jgi:photosystem II stability/assembly factor-like uncharacterized protein
LAGISCTNPSTCYAVGDGGTILATTNGGATWTQEASGTGAYLKGISCTNWATCFAVGDGGTILATSNAGATWTPQTSNTTAPLLAISCASWATCAAVGAGGTIRTTVNGGGWWSTQPSGTTADLYGVSCPTTATCFAVGIYGTILATTDGGSWWRALASGTGQYLHAVSCPYSVTTCYAVGSNGSIVRTGDGGVSWAAQASGTGSYLHGVSCLSASVCAAVGDGGVVLSTTNGGSTWGAQAVGTAAALHGASCPGSTCFAAGDGGTLPSFGTSPTSATATPVPPSATPTTPAGGATSTATPVPPSATPTGRSVFVIAMENQSWSAIKGSASAPYINNTLLPIASHAEQYYNPPNNHPSEPNYLWLEAGTNFGITNDNDPSLNHQSTTSHLVTLLNNAGISWKAYEEGISGTVCPLTSTSLYAVKHNPMVYFDNVTGTNNANSAYCIAHERPYSELASDLQNNSAARYNFITPDECDDMHNSSGCATGNQIWNGDAWLSHEVPKILNSQAYRNGGVLFITWDEAASGDGPIGLLALSPTARGHGYSNTIYYTHSSLLRTLEEIFGVSPFLGDAANATDLRDLFTSLP